MRVSPGIAAGHPATAEAGLELLAEGGTAADAAVGASLASCVAETVMTGLAGGGHAIWFDAETGTTSGLDFFVAVPGLGGPERDVALDELAVPFGDELVHYFVGIGSCAVPGVPAGLDALWRRHGRLPWDRVVAPALHLARSGVPMPRGHAACLAMLAPVMTLREGAAIYAPGGRLLEDGDRLEQPGLARALETVAAEGALTFYEGTLARELTALMEERGGRVTPEDLRAYAPAWVEPAETTYAGIRIRSRGGLTRLFAALASLPPLAPASSPDRAVALAGILAAPPYSGRTYDDTTNLCAIDPAGNACVVTTSLGLGSGDFLPGYDVHLNSMLGESDLLIGPLEPGLRMESMMSPTICLDDEGLVVAAGAAGGTRLRPALLQSLVGLLVDGLTPAEAVARPRLHSTGTVVHVEPGFSDSAVEALEDAGHDVRRWSELHHYFGGVSLAGGSGAAGDPRRSGAALLLR